MAGVLVCWDKKGNGPDAPWVYAPTQSYRDAAELAASVSTPGSAPVLTRMRA